MAYDLLRQLYELLPAGLFGPGRRKQNIDHRSARLLFVLVSRWCLHLYRLTRRLIAAQPRQPTMAEDEYYASEFTDEFLHSQADAGDCRLEENGYNCMPTQEEIQKMAAEGEATLQVAFIRNFWKGKTS